MDISFLLDHLTLADLRGFAQFSQNRKYFFLQILEYETKKVLRKT